MNGAFRFSDLARGRRVPATAGLRRDDRKRWLARDGRIDDVEDAEFLLLLQRPRPLQDPGAGADRRERIAEVMA